MLENVYDKVCRTLSFLMLSIRFEYSPSVLTSAILRCSVHCTVSQTA